MRLIDRVAYINHDIDDAVRAGLLREDELPAAADRGARRERLGAYRRAGARHGRALGARRRDRAGRSRPGRRWPRCASSCSSACTSGRRCAPSTARSRAWCGGCSSTTSSARSCCRRLPGEAARRGAASALLERRGRAGAARDGLPGGHDRPLLHPPLHRARRAAGVRPLALPTWRSTPTSPRTACAMRSISSSWCPRARSCVEPARRALRGCARSTTSARRRSASTQARRSTTASAARPPATCSRSCRRPRAWTSRARWSCWPSATAWSCSASRRTRARPSGARSASGCWSC